MEFTVKTPAVMGDLVGLYAVAEAMAWTYATANATTPLHRPAYDSDLGRHCTWLANEARAGRLPICGGDKLPTTWAALMVDEEPLDDRNACSMAWVSLDLLNRWATTHGHRFLLSTAEVPWIDERGIMGGALEDLTFELHDEEAMIKLKKPARVAVDEQVVQNQTPIERKNPTPRKNWRVVLPFLIEYQQKHRFQKCKSLFNALCENSDENAPIVKGVGDKHRGRLYVHELNRSYELKTFQTHIWPFLKDLPKKI